MFVPHIIRLGDALTRRSFQRFLTTSTFVEGPKVQLLGTRRTSAKGGLDLRKSLATVRESKRKRERREISGVPMAAEIAPEVVEALKVTDPPPESKIPVKPSVPKWRRKSRPEDLEQPQVFSTSVQVDPLLLRFLVGKGGSMKEKIETDTGASLRIPSDFEAKSGKAVVVEGSSQESLDKAVHQIHEVLDQGIKSPSLQYSHFISIPLALHPELVVSVTKFRESVLESIGSTDEARNDNGIDKSIFVKPATFHLTLLMLKLWNEDRVRLARDCLQKSMPQVHEALEGRPLSLKLTGVDCMSGDAAKAHVLYAGVEPNDEAVRLLHASKVITDVFTEAGLVMEKDQLHVLKLHATLMNTNQRAGGGGQGQRFKKRMPFNATDIVATYQSHSWGEHPVTEAHLSQRFVYDANGYYHCCCSIPFPLKLLAHSEAGPMNSHARTENL